MHELSIAMSLLDVAEQEARQQEGRVVALHVRIGSLSGVVTEALISAFDVAKQGTLFAKARLIIEETPLRCRCAKCAAERDVVSAQELRCAVCGAAATDLVSGRELDLTALEIE